MTIAALTSISSLVSISLIDQTSFGVQKLLPRGFAQMAVLKNLEKCHENILSRELFSIFLGGISLLLIL